GFLEKCTGRNPGGKGIDEHAVRREAVRRNVISNQPYGIALLGCGTVGGGVAKLLLEQKERLAARAGRPLVLRRVVVRDPSKARAVTLPGELLTTDVRTVINDPSIQLAVELIGGTDVVRRAV